MDIGIVSSRYAKALWGYAKSTQTADSLYQSMQTLLLVLQKNAALQKTLGNPLVSKEQKLSLLSTAAYGTQEPLPEFSNFIHLVLEKGREDLLLFICADYADLYRQHHNISTATVTTAVPINEARKKMFSELSGKLLHAHIDVETKVNPAIIGGFIFDIADYRLDASVATQLKSMKEQFLDCNKRIV